MQREYAVSFVWKNGLDEVNTGANTLMDAKRVCRWYYKGGKRQIVLKLYDNGDLQHQWDLSEDGKTWKQYE